LDKQSVEHIGFNVERFHRHPS